MNPVVLITGASGLLGRAIFRIFKNDPNWSTVGLAFSRAGGDLIKVDLTNKDEISAIFHKVKPNLVIHSAAERRPDVVDNKDKETHMLNIEATRYLCTEAAKLEVPVLYMSTDYVFDGKNPPFKETDQPNPLNKYGKSKLQGEEVTMGNLKDNMVLRVPILYGQIESLSESAVTIIFEKVKDTSKECFQSDYERRFPTHIDDVAVVVKKMSEMKLKNVSLSGIFHWSGDENMTKYNMAIAMAEVMNISNEHIKPDKTPTSGATRPYNAHLDSSKLEELGISARRKFKDAIADCLKPFV